MIFKLLMIKIKSKVRKKKQMASHKKREFLATKSIIILKMLAKNLLI